MRVTQEVSEAIPGGIEEEGAMTRTETGPLLRCGERDQVKVAGLTDGIVEGSICSGDQLIELLEPSVVGVCSEVHVAGLDHHVQVTGIDIGPRVEPQRV